MKVFIVGGDILIEKMFTKRGYTMADLPENADLLCFTGGADVHPAYYGEMMHPATRANAQRDEVESRIFKMYEDKPKVGICRGGQFLNVMSGGKMWQDVDQHAIGGTHRLSYNPDGMYNYNFDPDEDKDPNEGHLSIQVTSTHHQMMKPAKDKAELWGWCHHSRYRDNYNAAKRRPDRAYSPDVEIVYYEQTKSLCFQPHPEYGVKSCEDLFFTCLDRALAMEGVSYVKSAA